MCVHLLAVELILDVLWTATRVFYICVCVSIYMCVCIKNQNKTRKQYLHNRFREYITVKLNSLAVQTQQISLTYTHVPCPLFHDKRLLNTVALSFEKTSVGIKLD